MIKSLLLWFVERLKEPSSWNSLAFFLGVFGFNVEDALWQQIVIAGSGVCGLVGFIAKENTKQDLAEKENYKPSKLEEIVLQKSKGASNGNYNK